MSDEVFSIANSCFKLGEIWALYPDLTLPQILRALAGENVEEEIMVHSANGVPGTVTLETRMPNLETITNDKWAAMIDATYAELYGGPEGTA